MKISTSHKSGFTLVELLVVIAIIAVLAVLGTQVGTKAIQQARKLESKTDLLNICGAMEGFKADNNGVYPNIAGGTVGVNVNATDSGLTLSGGGTAGDLVAVLLGDDTVNDPSGNTINARGKSYFDAKQAKADGSSGVDLGGTHSFTDYWGNAYQIIWDSNYDDQLNDPLDAAGPAIRRGVIALGQGASTSALSGALTPKEKLQIVTSW